MAGVNHQRMRALEVAAIDEAGDGRRYTPDAGSAEIKLRKPSRSPLFEAAFFFVVSLARKKRLFESLSRLPPLLVQCSGGWQGPFLEDGPAQPAKPGPSWAQSAMIDPQPGKLDWLRDASYYPATSGPVATGDNGDGSILAFGKAFPRNRGGMAGPVHRRS